MADLRVMVIGDDPLTRAGLGLLLANQPGCTVAGQIAADADIPAATAVYRPDILLWDLGWDPARVLPALAAIQDLPFPSATLAPDGESAVEAWSAGARAILLREIDPGRLVAALTAVAQGLVVLDPALAGALIQSREETFVLPAEQLTARELEVLRLLAEGLANKAIAQQLAISEHTVKFHVNAILGKLNAQSRTEAVVRATRLGLILL